MKIFQFLEAFTKIKVISIIILMEYIIVANRLPFVIKKDLTFERSPGGLVSGLLTFLKKAKIKKYKWIGWPGKDIDKRKLSQVQAKCQRHKAYPVFIPKKELDRFYNGFCNKTLWPLFHGFQSYAHYDKTFWNAYVSVNQTFCEEVVRFIKEDSVVWVHDYHFMLLPALLRERFPDIMIGFFLHIPFPPPELFMQLPWRKELLEGLLGCDLIGFHAYEYTNNFLRSLSRIFGLEHKMGTLFFQNRYIKADTFPMGIDFELFYKASQQKKIQSLINKIKKQLKDKKVIFSVDRLDYTKGIYNRLLAFEELLKKNEEFREKVVLIMVVVPSREGVEQYQRMKKQLEEKISEINGKFATINWTPVHYYYRSLDFNELVAHYVASDVILVTPLKDGMNLIAKEFVASRRDKKGVLILSEFAGSAKELGEAIIVNPNSIENLREAMESALKMSLEEQAQRIVTMQERLIRYDIIKWGKDFFTTLEKLQKEKDKLKTKIINSRLIKRIKEDFFKAKTRIFFFDYDGTLVPIASKPSLAIPDEELLQLLKHLTTLRNTEIVLISGRRKDFLDTWFGDLGISLVAEHGALIKRPGQDWEAAVPIPEDIKQGVRNIMEMYVDRLPQSFIEEKEFSLVFHYRNADPELASVRVAELIDELLLFTANVEANILLGNKIVEVRPAGVDKGSTARLFLHQKEFEFILGAGDDVTDEDLFKALPDTAHTIKVGVGKSFAKYSAPSYKEIRNLLRSFF